MEEEEEGDKMEREKDAEKQRKEEERRMYSWKDGAMREGWEKMRGKRGRKEGNINGKSE